MDGSSHLMVSDVMEMALPVTVSEESEFEHDQLHSGSEDPVDGALERPVVGYSGSSSGGVITICICGMARWLRVVG